MLKITQTLLSTWGYTFQCQEEYQEDAYADFLAKLRRENPPPTDAMKNGLEFEDEVYKQADGLARTPHPKWERGICAVATELKGAVFQVKLQSVLTIGKTELLLEGVLDALRAGSIYDVTFLNKSFGSAELAGKYLESPQHPAYFYLVPEAFDFTYLVSDGSDLYKERYTPDMCRPFPELAKQFLDWLDGAGLMEIYQEHWQI